MFKKYGTIVTFLLVLALSCITITSCNKNNNSEGELEILSESTPLPEVTSSLTEGPELTSKSSDDIEDEAKDSYKQALANSQKISIYCINDDGSDIESVATLIDENAEISALTITEAEVKEFSDRNLNVKVDNVTEDEKGNVIVSFKKGSAPAKHVKEEVEGLILDCISQSILDNVESSKTVIFQIEGNAYQSKHISYGIDEAYSWK